MLTALLVIAGLQSQPVALPRDAPATAPAAVSGRVTERDSGRPLPRIVVTALRLDPFKRFDAITDADGRYSFTGLDAGEYAISAGPDEHRSTYLRQRFGAAAPGLSLREPERPNLELKPGETRSGLDIALVRALAIEGRVIDPWEEGMANVTVLVTRVGDRLDDPARASSDDRGFYRVYSLAPGRYRVCADIGQDASSVSDSWRLGRTCHPSSVVEADAGVVVLSSHDAGAVDIRVQRFGVHSISGVVVDASGSPVDGAGVGAYSVDDSGGLAYAMTRGGEFVLKGLAPGRYVVRASVGETNPGEARPRREPEVGYASADVTAGDLAGVAITTSRPIDVAGSVTFEGAPAMGGRRLGMVVQTRPVHDRLAMFDRRPPFSPVDDDLSFELKGVYRLPLIVGTFGLPDGWVLKSVRYDGRDITDVPTDLGERPSAGGLAVVVTNRAAQPSVRVLDERGTATTSCQVIAVPADPSRWRFALGAVGATPAPDGVLKLGAMLPGEYLIAALPPHEGVLLFRDPARIDAVAAVATRVRLVEGDTRTFELRLVSLPPDR